MYPEIHPFGIHVHSYVAMLIVAVLLCHWLGPFIGERLEGLPRWKVRSILLWLGIAAFAGGRAHFVWNSWSFGAYMSHPGALLAFWRGLHAGGALLALTLALPIIVCAHGISLGRFVDALAPTIALGVAAARVGCFLQGCCFGTTSDLPWAVSFPAGSPVVTFQASSGIIPRGALWSAAVHPLQLYFAGAALVAAFIGLWMYKRRAYPGRVALCVAAIALTSSALAEMVRAPYYPQFYFWGSRLQFEWIAIAMALTALTALSYAETRSRFVLDAEASARIKRAAS